MVKKPADRRKKSKRKTPVVNHGTRTPKRRAAVKRLADYTIALGRLNRYADVASKAVSSWWTKAPREGFCDRAKDELPRMRLSREGRSVRLSDLGQAVNPMQS